MGITLSKEGPSEWFYDGEALSRNVEKIRTPILFNISDAEVLAARQDLVAMEEYGKPFESYVFPEESHTKWQPSHLYNIWRRNVQWLQFWLQDKEVSDPVDPRQYARWRELKNMQEENDRKMREAVTGEPKR